MSILLDIKAIEEEARKELQNEMGVAAKGKIKASLRAIALAEKALLNLRNEHEVLLRDLASSDEEAAA
jgi:hypothetical protein